MRMKWRIGEWLACGETDTLRSDVTQRKLERRAMEALLVLAEHAGRVVMKDELIAAVWGRLAVSDHSVAMVVSQLRRALGDDARSPRYIETITKRGYRLIAACEPIATEVRSDAVSAALAPKNVPLSRALAFLADAAAKLGIAPASRK